MPERSDPHGAPRVLALTDLLFGARIRAAAQTANVDVIVLRTPAALVAAAVERAPRRILIDLDARGHDPVDVIRSLKDDARTSEVDVVAFVSHVREDAIRAARDAGADRVLARSAFVRQLPDLVNVEA
ncbi:MAG: hypothetical protein ACREM1_00260 [Longimicrobiales bacterium]